MKELVLLLDFGASRTKSVIANLQTGEFNHPLSRPALKNVAKQRLPSSHRVEISLKEFETSFLETCHYYLEKLALPVQEIYFCSEMHGFIVLDEKDNPLTEYISWRDQRSLETTTFQEVSEVLGKTYKGITGMRIRPSLPFVNFLQLATESSLPRHCSIISLPEWLPYVLERNSLGRTLGAVHETMTAGLGFYDLWKNTVSPELKAFVQDKVSIQPEFTPTTTEITPAAYLKTRSREIPLFTAVGDHPCAVLGAGNIPKQHISVNIGTGSQVSIINYDHTNDALEYRPYFGGSNLATITHIPAGRALNVCLGFLEETARCAGATSLPFWDMLQKLSAEEILDSKLDMDLAFFPGAWNYSSGGSIQQIGEDGLSLRNFLASTLRSLAAQYRDVIQLMDPKKLLPEIKLSGGIPQRIPELGKVISQMTARRTEQSPQSTDETLLGLRTLALNGVT